MMKEEILIFWNQSNSSDVASSSVSILADTNVNINSTGLGRRIILSGFLGYVDDNYHEGSEDAFGE